MNGLLYDLRNVFRGGALHLQLVVINVLVYVGIWLIIFAGGLSLERAIISQIELPASFMQFLYRPWTLLTYAFWHASPAHILFNMVGLYWFGQMYEDFVGRKRLLSVYILSILSGGVGFLLLYNLVPALRANASNTVLVGASGGVYGVIIGATVLSPTRLVQLFIFGLVQIRYVAGAVIFISVFGLLGSNAGGNIAHLTGAFMGYFFTSQLRKGNDWGRWIHIILDGVAGWFKPKPTVKVTYSKPKEKATVNQTKARTAQSGQNGGEVPNQQEIDAILDKISASGYDSLTKEEKIKLHKMSES